MSPPTDHARTAADSAGGAGGRTGWPLPVDDTPSSILAPLLSRVPAMSISGIQGISASGISSLKGLGGLLPRPAKLAPVDETSAAWAELALDGGQRRQRLLLLTSPTHALQVFAYRPSTIPDDAHVAEPFPPPEEVASIPTIVYEPDAPKSVLQGVRTQRAPGPRRAVSAHLLDRAHWGTRGPVVALITVTAATDVPLGHGHLSLVLLDLTSGKAFRRLDLGTGVTASVTSTPRVIVIATSHPTPSIHVLDTNLERVRPPITDLPVHSSTRLPVSSVSGRLLAYATAEPALTPGADGLGSIVAATSARLRASSASSAHSASRTPQTTQGALLNSAVEIGGGVARGVWAGLKMGARAAQQASSSRLASSAPNERGLAMPDVEHSSVNESRSVEDAVEEMPPAGLPGGVWVKIVDLFSVQTGDKADVVAVAHFRLPPTRLLVPSLPTAQHPRGHPAPREHPIAFLSFSPEGTRLLAAAADGRVFHVLDVRPRGAAVGKQKSRGEVWDAYVLRRGNTTADVRSVTWSRDERWIAVGTGKGTVHVFPISPAGGKPSAASHVKTKLANPIALQPLSVEVSPFARLRPLPAPEEGEDPNPGAVYAVSVFASTRPHPLDKGTLCQDVAIYRAGQLELARLAVHPATPAPTPPEGAHRRRGSNLTEMMREKAGLLPADGDLVVEQVVKARWVMPLGQGPSDGTVQWNQVATAKTPSAGRRGNSIYHAEIRTHSTSARILPASVYLARQVEFFAAVPTDEYSPLSVLDKVARRRRLIFRPEVEVHPSTGEAVSFDKPLSSALHSVIEGRPVSQLPQLPNGSPSKGGIFSSIPIRHVAANLGEGVDRVRREYVRAQHSRARRRTSNAASHASNSAGVSISFEDDTVLASRPPSDGSEDVASSPSSALIPNTAPNSSLADDDDGWAEPWEDEYARAVADDGGPDDLVLGLLDEEEEERRQWEERQRALATKLARGGAGGGAGGGERGQRG